MENLINIIIHPFNSVALLRFIKDVLTEEQKDRMFKLADDKHEIYEDLKTSDNQILIKDYNCLFEITVEKLN